MDYAEVGFIMNTNTEKIYPYGDNKILRLDRYSVVYSKPTYLYSQLQSEYQRNKSIQLPLNHIFNFLIHCPIEWVI